MSAKAETLADVFAEKIGEHSKRSGMGGRGMESQWYAAGRVDAHRDDIIELDRYVRHLNDLANRRESEGLTGEAAGLRAAVALLGGGR